MADNEPTQRWADLGITHQSLQSAVTKSLREAILRGRFRPGERLTEPMLAQYFQVSRSPVREALRVLEAEGLIEGNPRRGARVRLVSDQEAAEVIELRAELERFNAQNATQRCDDELRSALQRVLKEGNEVSAGGDTEALRAINDRFHATVGEGGRNRYLTDYIRTLREKTLWLFASAQGDRVLESWREHAAIAEAILAGDPELSGLLAARHVKRVGEVVRAELGKATEALREIEAS
jgi:DNA-binding GntR family transcriptional regulator